MKTVSNIAAILLILLMIATGSNVFAQGLHENKHPEHYQIKIVREENGKKEEVDKTFSDRSELEAFLKANDIRLEEIPEPPQAQVPPSPPAPLGTMYERASKGKNVEQKIQVLVVDQQESAGSKKLTPGKKKIKEELTLAVRNDKNSLETMAEGNAQKETKVPGEPSGKDSQEPPMGGIIGSEGLILNELSLFPNPSNGNFHISFRTSQPSDVTLRLTDMTGKQVYFNIIRNQQGLFEKDVFFAGGLPKGTYLLEALAAGQRLTTRVIVE